MLLDIENGVKGFIRALQPLPDDDLRNFEYDACLEFLQGPGGNIDAAELLCDLYSCCNPFSRATKKVRKGRAISTLHILAYNRKQTFNRFQRGHGGNSRTSSEAVLHMDHLMGIALHQRTHYKHRGEKAEKHFERVKQVLQERLGKQGEWRCCLLNIDDFHNIHETRTPESSDTWQQIHMATVLLVAIDDTTATLLPQDPNYNPADIHSTVIKNQLKDIYMIEISQNYHTWKENHARTMSKTLPEAYFGTSMQVYKEMIDNRRHERTMKQAILLDQVENRLKSMGDYMDALRHVLDNVTDLRDYLATHALPIVADWPGQMHLRHQSMLLFLGLADTTVPREASALRPMVGPLHLALNGQELIFKEYRKVLFADFFEHLFGKRKHLAEKPKPWRVALVLKLARRSWLTVRGPIIARFDQQTWKNPTYCFLLNILDNWIPLVLDVYDVILRSGDLEAYIHVVFRLWTLFYIFDRHNYKKAPLAFLSDVLSWKDPKHPEHGLWLILNKSLVKFHEYWVENYHSAIRASSRSDYDGQHLQKISREIFAEYNQAFFEVFGFERQHSLTEKEKKSLDVQGAEFWVNLFGKAFVEGNKTTFDPKKKEFMLGGLNVTVAPELMPMGYALAPRFGVGMPDINIQCDECCKEKPDERVFFSCGHSVHICCLPKPESQVKYKCAICEIYLMSGIDKNVAAFLESLKKVPRSKATENVETDLSVDNEGENDDNLQASGGGRSTEELNEMRGVSVEP